MGFVNDGPWANFETVNCLPFVTPEDFGAVGDGVTDDTNAMKSAANEGGFIILKKDSIYKITSQVSLVSNTTIIGNGATINSGTSSAFYIAKTEHDIQVFNLIFTSDFTVGDTTTPSNSCIGIAASNTTEEYEAYNIEIGYCSFTFGVFGIAGSSVQNLYIHDCEFYGGVYRPDDSAGGYAILTQSCSNVTIERCYFKLGMYARHDIYVSVSPTKTDNISSRNYRISNCFSDRSLITDYENDAFYSSTILSVAVRSVYNFLLENYRVYNGTGLVNFSTADGPVVNATVRNCVNDTPRLKSSSVMLSEMRQSFGFMGASGSDVKFEKCVTLNVPINFSDYSVGGGYIEVCDSTLNARLDVSDCDFLHVHDMFVKGTFLRFTGTGVLHGKFHSLDSDGSYIWGSATNFDNGAYIDINAYEDKLLGPWAIAASGALTNINNKLHIAATGAAESNDNGTIVTLTYSRRPSEITRAMSLTDGGFMEVNATTGSLGTNQIRLRKLLLSNGGAATSRTCRFYLC